MSRETRVAWALFVVRVTVIVALHCSIALGARCAVRAQPGIEGGSDGGRAPGAALERRLALAIAKVAVNEASLERVQAADVALIYQATLAHGQSARARLRWLERHSSCVLTDRSLRDRELRTNCVWTRGLRDGDAQPEGWPVAIAWSVYVRRWRSVRRAALELVLGTSSIPLPCVEQPTTWGGAMDHEHALRRGLRRVVCRGTANSGYMSARRRAR